MCEFLQTFRDKTESSRSVEVWMASTMEQQTMVIIHDDVMMTSSEMYYPQLSIVNLSERMATPKVYTVLLTVNIASACQGNVVI